MRPTSRESLRRAVLWAGVVVALLAGCEASETPGAGQPATSALAEQVDGDRLWVLLQAARIDPRCGDHYTGASGVEGDALAGSCDAFEDRALRWLQINGVNAQQEDIRDPSLWAWYTSKVRDILTCKRNARATTAGSVLQMRMAEATCDPYERITRVDASSLEIVGIRRPEVP
jgi:hypothetical protein